jgi:hypothetical protein
MRSFPKILSSIAGLLILLSCAPEPPTGPDPAADAGRAAPSGPDKSLQQAVINNYVVQYDGRIFDGAETSFHYTVFGTGVEPALSHFTLELPDCAPELSGYAPTNSVSINYDPNTGLYGIDWHLAVAADDLVGRQYSITFPGDVPEGVIHSAVRSGDVSGVGQVFGPCAGYEIAGAVYVDADTDGERDFDESGIAGVAVELEHADGTVEVLITDPLGEFRTIRAEGTYTLRIPATYPGAFNGELGDSFDATTATEISVTVGPDATGNAFGFAPQSEELIYELETGILVSSGESVRFWTQELRAALRNGGGNVQYDRATMEAFLAEIQTLYLAEIFQFTPGNELQEAYDLLKSNSREPIDELARQLLATEFNEVSGRGLTGEYAELQDVLIAWGEAVWVENQAARARPEGPGTGSRPDHGSVILADDLNLPPAIDVFTLINTGGGGGVDE